MRANYDSKRPLTEEERAFGELPENHDLIYKFCSMKGYDVSEYYDILSVAYVQSVKKYHEVARLHENFAFGAILFNDLRRTMGNHFQAMTRKKRMPEGGLCSLNHVFADGGESCDEYNPALIDESADIEQQIIEEESRHEYDDKLQKFMDEVDKYCKQGFNTMDFKACVELLIQGYTKKKALQMVNRDKERRKGEIVENRKRRTCFYIFNEYDEWDLDYDLGKLREVFQDIFGI